MGIVTIQIGIFKGTSRVIWGHISLTAPGFETWCQVYSPFPEFYTGTYRIIWGHPVVIWGHISGKCGGSFSTSGVIWGHSGVTWGHISIICSCLLMVHGCNVKRNNLSDILKVGEPRQPGDCGFVRFKNRLFSFNFRNLAWEFSKFGFQYSI